MPEVMFRRVEFFERVESMRAVIVAAFVDNDLQTGFPAVKRAVAMRTEVFGFRGSFITVVGLKSRQADLAAQL